MISTLLTLSEVLFVCLLLFYGFSDKCSIGKLTLIITLTYIFYELLGLLNIHGTFDLYDIIAIIISGICTYFILNRCLK